MRAFNLIPDDEHAGIAASADRSGGGAFVVLGLLAGLAVLALLYGKARHQISSQRGQVATLTAQAQRAQAQAAQLGPYTSFQALRQQRTQSIETLVNSRFDWAHAFHELGRVLPPETSLQSVSGTIGAASGSSAAATSASTTSAATTSGAAVTSATPPGSVPSFTLSGCASSQTAVALTLDRLRLIDGVEEVTLQSSTKGTSGGGSGGGESCLAGDPVFAVQVTFEPLPSASATSAAGAASTTTPAADTAAGQPAPSGGGGASR